jgi:uncharacterized membrane protein YjfL (UPF0719 family)
VISARPLYVLAFAAVTLAGMLLVAQAAKRLAPGRAPARQASPARTLLEGGYLFGLFSVGAGVVGACVHGEDLAEDALWTAVFATAGLLLLEGVGRLGVLLLVRSRLREEIDAGNVAAGIAGGAHYAATGILIARCLGGDDMQSLVVSLVFFVLAELTLQTFVSLFRAVTRYDDAEEILDQNTAAAVSYAGVTLALALIVGHAAEAPFVSWGTSLRAYAVALAFAVALYPVRQLVVCALLLGGAPVLRGGRLDQTIARERNVGASALEAVSYLATAFVVTRVA